MKEGRKEATDKRRGGDRRVGFKRDSIPPAPRDQQEKKAAESRAAAVRPPTLDATIAPRNAQTARTSKREESGRAGAAPKPFRRSAPAPVELSSPTSKTEREEKSEESLRKRFRPTIVARSIYKLFKEPPKVQKRRLPYSSSATGSLSAIVVV